MNSEYEVYNILLTFYDMVKLNDDLFDKVTSIDKSLNFNKQKILDIIQYYLNKQSLVYSILEKSKYSDKVIIKNYIPIGTVKVYIETDNIGIFVETLLALIMTKNKGIFEMKKSNLVIPLIINMVNEIIGEKLYTTENLPYYNKTICIGTKKYFESAFSNIHTGIGFYNYSKPNLIIENVEIDIDTSKYKCYNNDNLKEVIDEINSSDNFTTCIFSKDESKMMYFLENCKSKNLYLNTVPNDDLYLDINLNELLEIKNTIIKN